MLGKGRLVMRYVFDSGPLIDMFSHYYRQRFPSLWQLFDTMIERDLITSTREVFNELTTNRDDYLSNWCNEQRQFFVIPNEAEQAIIRDIFSNQHFQGVLRKKERLSGKPVADPFVVARARSIGGCVVTTEKYRPNAPKIPNICEAFDVECANLEEFMEREEWQF